DVLIWPLFSDFFSFAFCTTSFLVCVSLWLTFKFTLLSPHSTTLSLSLVHSSPMMLNSDFSISLSLSLSFTKSSAPELCSLWNPSLRKTLSHPSAVHKDLIVKAKSKASGSGGGDASHGSLIGHTS